MRIGEVLMLILSDIRKRRLTLKEPKSGREDVEAMKWIDTLYA